MTTTTFIPGNNVNTTLAAATPASGAGSTTFTLASSTNLPTLSGGAQMPLTLNDAATGGIYEIVYVTAITGATLTAVRAQEGTTAQSWNIGDFAFCAPTAGTVAQIDGNPAQQFQVAAATAVNQAPQTGQLQTNSVSYAVGTGTANAHTIALAPALTARTDGMLLRYKAPAANTSAVTLTDGVGTVAVIGSGHVALQGGEYIANGDALVMWNSTINSGTYILLECTGGALQVSPATQSQHAVQAQQMSAVVGLVKNLVANQTAAAATLTITADEVGVKSALGGVAQILPNFNVTVNTGNSGNLGLVGAALTASSFAAVYASWGPTVGVGAFIANADNLVPEVFGGTLPTGYTESALIAVWPLSASKQFVVGLQFGRRLAVVPVSFLTYSTPVAVTSTSIATLVPKNARLISGSQQISNTAASNMSQSLYTTSSGLNPKPNSAAINVPATVGEAFENLPLLTPQTVFVSSSSTAGTSSFSASLSAYEI